MQLLIELKLEKEVKDIEKLIEGRIYTIDGIDNAFDVTVRPLEIGQFVVCTDGLRPFRSVPDTLSIDGYIYQRVVPKGND